MRLGNICRDLRTRSPASPAPSARYGAPPAATTSSNTRRCSRASSSSATWSRSLRRHQCGQGHRQQHHRPQDRLDPLSWIPSTTPPRRRQYQMQQQPTAPGAPHQRHPACLHRGRYYESVLQLIWNSGSKRDVIMTGGFDAHLFSTLVGSAPPRPAEDAQGGGRSSPRWSFYKCNFGSLTSRRPLPAGTRRAG